MNCRRGWGGGGWEINILFKVMVLRKMSLVFDASAEATPCDFLGEGAEVVCRSDVHGESQVSG